MIDIPKDIAEIASRLASRAISKNLSPIETVEYVAQQAILEERERCARICDDKGFLELGDEIRKGGAE